MVDVGTLGAGHTEALGRQLDAAAEVHVRLVGWWNAVIRLPRIEHQARHSELRAEVIEVGTGGEGLHRLLRLVVGALAEQ